MTDAQRSDDAERLPINVWGDVLTNGDAPIVRRVLTGMDAQECMYAWVYLSELVSLREMARGPLPDSLSSANGAVGDLDAAFKALHKLAGDPQHQVTKEIIQTHALAAVAALACGEDATEFCELGSTFFSSIEKLQVVARLLRQPLATHRMLFSGIERSPFMQRTARTFYPDHQLTFVRDWREWQPQRRWCHYLSRFVANYAFNDTAKLTEFLERFQVVNLTEVFNAEAADFSTWDLGLPITFLSLPTLAEQLIAQGWRVYLTDLHPDFHAPRSQRCFVGRLFAIRGDAADRCGFFERANAYADLAALLARSEIRPGQSADDLVRATAAISEARWEQIKCYKEVFPIWGRVPENFNFESWKRAALKPNELHLTFDAPAIVAAVNAARTPR